LNQLLAGGVWIAAIGQTLAMGVMVGVFTGKANFPSAAVVKFIPELEQFTVIPEAPPAPPSSNGPEPSGA
jgi:hypothetical protein